MIGQHELWEFYNFVLQIQFQADIKAKPQSLIELRIKITKSHDLS